jgi:hypothetical protein
MALSGAKPKAERPSSKSPAGMQMHESDEQSQNAFDSIRKSLEPDSNVTLESA